MNKKRLMITRRQRLKRRQTLQERLIKTALDELGIIHRVQYLVSLWNFSKSYILDFYLPEYNLAIEVDGQTHRTEEGMEYDKIRGERLLNTFGIETVRFDNEEIHNLLITIHLVKTAVERFPKLISISHTRVPHRIDSRNNYKTLALSRG